ncbi:MAG TPA: VOC family protein [Steroidobacteraceae bacterium]|nr:VOC family protein [Steroidobacteraceae bacterium]
MPRIVHVEIQDSDPEVLARFYVALFGWKVSRWGDAPYWLVDIGDAAQPGINGGLLSRRGPPPADGQSVNAFVCTVEVPSVDEYFAKAPQLGGKAALPKMPIPTVGWLAYVKDPDGNILGLMQPDPGAR